MMTSAIISKVEKANRYAHERDRLTFSDLQLEVRGDNDTHHVTLQAGSWGCTCHFFDVHHNCVHVLTAQKVLDGMLPAAAQVSLYDALEAEIQAEPTLPQA